jgi:hypothetical protein
MKDFEEFLSLVRKRTEQRKKAEASGQAQQLAVSSLSTVLPSGDCKEINLGTVSSPQVKRAAAPRLADLLAEKQAETFCLTSAGKGQERKASGGNQTEGCIKGESAAAVPPDALQGVPLSDQEREDIAAGLTPEQARRAAEARVDTLEWLLGLETLTQEQAELVASFRRMDAALISSRGDKPYLNSLGIPRFPPNCEPKYLFRLRRFCRLFLFLRPPADLIQPLLSLKPRLDFAGLNLAQIRLTHTQQNPQTC